MVVICKGDYVVEYYTHHQWIPRFSSWSLALCKEVCNELNTKARVKRYFNDQTIYHQNYSDAKIDWAKEGF